MLAGIGRIGNIGGIGGGGRLSWALDAAYAFDFPANAARWNGAGVGALANVPGWTFARASTAYAMNNAGLLVPFGSGVARITDRGFLAEGSRINRALYSRDLTNAAWVASNCTVAKTSTGADGVGNGACRLTATAGNATVLQSITHTSTARYFSAFVRRITGTGNVQVTLDGGSTWTTVTLTASYAQVGAGQTVTNPQVGFRIVTSGDAIDVDFSQCEDGAFPSSPIDTTTASVTRAADSLTITGVTGLDYPVSVFAEWERNHTDSATFFPCITIDTGSSNDSVQIVHRHSTLINRVTQTSGGVSQADVGLAAAPLNQINRTVARFALNDVNGAVNGTVATADTSATAPAAPSRIVFGANSAISTFWFGYIRRIAILTRALTNAELASWSYP